MRVCVLSSGSKGNSTYVETKNHKILIDIGTSSLYVEKALKEINVNPSDIDVLLITHSHVDHIGALRNFLTKRSIKIFKRSNLEEKEYTVGDFKFNCILTPGHSKDSVTFYFKEENTMFIGDFIFKDSIGRTDLPGGSDIEMKESITKIKEYPNDTILYPGHYESTTLGYEKENNEYLK